MKVTNILFLIFYLLIQINVFAQTPTLQWQRATGGTASDSFLGLKKNTDGSLVTVGFSNSNNKDVIGAHGGLDAYIVKFTVTGAIVWSKLLGGTGDERFTSLTQTIDGGYVAVGYSTSNDGDVTGNHGSIDEWVVKLDGNGNLQWQKCFGGGNDDKAFSVTQSNDGNYLIAGQTDSNDGDVSGNRGNWDCWLIKVSESGMLLWQKCFGGTASDGFTSLTQTADNGIVLCGNTQSNDGDVTGFHGLVNAFGVDFWVVKTDGAGNLQWQKCFGGSAFQSSATKIVQTTDGGFLVAGNIDQDRQGGTNGDIETYYGNYDFWVIKITDKGAIEWQRTLGGTAFDFCDDAISCTDGGFLLIGGSASNDHDVVGGHGGNEFWAVKLAGQGDTEWQICLGGTQDENAYGVVETSKCEYVLAGASNSNDGQTTNNRGGQDAWIVDVAVPQVIPTVSITSSPVGSICPGTAVTFSAVPINGGKSPYYQWKKNGQEVGGSDAEYMDSMVTGADVISVVMHSNAACATSSSVESNPISVPVEELQLSITATPGLINAGGTVIVNTSANISYKIIKWQPAELFSNQTASSQKLTANTDLTITATGISSSGCTTQASTVIKVQQFSAISIPNTFSPNGDAINDTWNIAGLANYPDAIVTVYNRYGERIFEERGYQTPWDGKYNSKKLPFGAYYYLIRNLNGHQPMAGWVAIIY